MTFFEWRYVVEIEVAPDEWRSTNVYDDVVHAVKEAEGETRNARVRQFKATVYQPEPVVPTYKTQTGATMPVVPWFCPSCPGESVKAMTTSTPLCPTCHQDMFRGTKL